MLSHDLWSARIDPTQIESAILNLAINSRDAMPEGGKLVVETRNVRIDASMTASNPDLVPGDYVQISISDTGAGMTSDVKERAFEPFFTTKARGHGTGLGLSMVYGFAKQSGGQVTIYSEVGHGTTINIYLPRVADGAESTADTVAEPEAKGAAGEPILVVEDDERVRNLTVNRLKGLGYQVHEAADGATALKMLESGLAVDLVFSDLVMPGGLTGRDVARRAKELDASMKVLLTSGHAEDLARSEDLGDIKLLRKPYRLSDLRTALNEALGRLK